MLRCVGKPTPPLLGEGLIARRIEVAKEDVVLVRAHLEAHDGLGLLFAEHGGDLVLAAPTGRAAELDDFVSDLETQIRLSRVDW